jgi:hypothetical protein
MPMTEKTENAAPKGAAKKRATRKRAGEPKAATQPKPKPTKPKPTKPASGQAQVVKKMLAQIETKMGKNQMKATMGDYIRLVQLHKELDEESPKEIKVTWVEPAGNETEKTGSGNEE